MTREVGTALHARGRVRHQDCDCMTLWFTECHCTCRVGCAPLNSRPSAHHRAAAKADPRAGWSRAQRSAQPQAAAAGGLRRALILVGRPRHLARPRDVSAVVNQRVLQARVLSAQVAAAAQLLLAHVAEVVASLTGA